MIEGPKTGLEFSQLADVLAKGWLLALMVGGEDDSTSSVNSWPRTPAVSAVWSINDHGDGSTFPAGRSEEQMAGNEFTLNSREAGHVGGTLRADGRSRDFLATGNRQLMNCHELQFRMLLLQVIALLAWKDCDCHANTSRHMHFPTCNNGIQHFGACSPCPPQ